MGLVKCTDHFFIFCAGVICGLLNFWATKVPRQILYKKYGELQQMMRWFMEIHFPGTAKIKTGISLNEYIRCEINPKSSAAITFRYNFKVKFYILKCSNTVILIHCEFAYF